MTTYARVTYRPAEGARARTIILQDPMHRFSGLLGNILTGVEVNREGDEVTARGTDERIHFISTALVVRETPLVMDKIYGTLVPPNEATPVHSA